MFSQNYFFNKYNLGESDFVSPGKQMQYIAQAKPESTAIYAIDKSNSVTTITWSQLHVLSNQMAWLLIEKGVMTGSSVIVSFPNGIDHIIAALAIWKAGACYLPISSKTPVSDLNEICRIISPSAAFSDLYMPEIPICINANDMYEHISSYPDSMPADVAANPNMISLSGGTSGKLKFIRQNIPCGMSDCGIKSWFTMSGMDFDQRQLLVGPLFHGSPHTAAFNGLFVGNTLVIPRNLCPDNIVKLIKEYQIEFIQVVPTLLNRLIKLPNVSKYDFSSIKAICHTGGVCPAHIKQNLIDLIGPEKVYEIYSMTEVIGLTFIRGDEWLQHRGSVGLPAGGGKISIRDKNGKELPPFEIGEIFMTPPSDDFYTEYINQTPLDVKEGGFRSVGDVGYADEKGYLYFSDRRSDMIVTGGENVFAAEIENVMLRHEDILDVVVVGIPDEEWGRRLHAVVEAKRDLSANDLKEYLSQYLLSYKIPKTFEFVRFIQRKDNGKVVREKIIQDCVARGV